MLIWMIYDILKLCIRYLFWQTKSMTLILSDSSRLIYPRHIGIVKWFILSTSASTKSYIYLRIRKDRKLKNTIIE